MSAEDRERWNRRYREGAYAGRDHPAQWLVHCLGRLGHDDTNDPIALDLACGAGRNALFLAEQGYTVYALDVAAAALQRGREKNDITVHWVERDLDQGLPDDLPAADLILMIRYLDLDLITSAARQLKPGGHLVVDVHLRSDQDVSGPRNPDFRAAPGALRNAVVNSGLHLIEYREEHTTDPDGQRVALARAQAEKRQ